MRVSESASKPNRSRTGGREAKAMTELARNRPSSRSSSAAAVSRTGLSWRRLRSATRTGDGGHAVALVAGEDGLDQRGEPARVGAQHGDVARLEAGLAVGAVLLEQVEERVAQHLDLAGGAVGAVPADAGVG